jgi:Ca-activated chloride channel homolog
MQSLGRLDISYPALSQPVSLCPRLGLAFGERRRFASSFSQCISVLLFPLILFGSAVVVARTSSSTTNEGIRVDLPASGRLRVENHFGNVAVEVWKEKDVSVAAIIDGRTSTNRSPVVIERRNDFLSISVVLTPIDPPLGVNLTLRVPERARVEISTGDGVISCHGLSVSMSLNTVSGNIRAELESPVDADIIAKSVNGMVRSELGAMASGDGHLLQSRLGTGKLALRAITQRGEITLALLAGTGQQAQADQRPPELLGSSNSSKGAGTPANQSTSEEVGEGDVIRVDAQLTTLNLSVIDRGTNRGLAGLIQSDFKLFEDGVEQRILQFDSSAAPFDLVLLIDLSGSTRDVVKLIRAAARRFVDAARPSDRIAIISFAGQPTLVAPLTLDRELLRQRVNAIDTLPGDTKLYDAADFAVAEVLKGTKNSRRTAIVLMSDGLDGSIPGVHGQQGSKLSYKELIDRVREFDGVLYTLWLNTYYEALNPQDTQPEAFDTAYDRMKEMADAGGGFFYEVERLEDLAGAYERVVSDLGTVYSLAYRPSNKARDGKWRAIRVSVDRRDAVARGKHGYYAN